MTSEDSQCQAVIISDDQRCKNDGTHSGGLFCWFHSKQAHGLYMGYKRRNTRLDAMDNDPPPYLKNTKTPLTNQTFEAVDDMETLNELHRHLFEKYVVAGKVIEARKMYTKNFYSFKYDYGHQAYIDTLSSRRHAVFRALNRLGKRTAKVLYQKEQWFAWARKVQEEEEATRDKEQKKIKQEAALFRRHVKTLEARHKLQRQKEEQMRQDAYLESAYQERMALDDEDWDPIDDAEDDKRNRFIDLIRHFLWMEVLSADKTNGAPANSKDEPPHPQPLSRKAKKKARAAKAANPSASTTATPSTSSASNAKKTDSSLDYNQITLLELQNAPPVAAELDLPEPDKKNIETEAEMRTRLSSGVKKNYDQFHGFQFVGTLEDPFGSVENVAPMTNDEVEQLSKDVKEIKMFLFCRILLAQASLLPAALRSDSVEQFLSDADVTEAELRDVCLKLEAPTLQEIRDACADFARGDEAEDDEEVSDDDDDDETLEDMLVEDKRYAHLHTDSWLFESMLSKYGHSRRKIKARPKTKVTICGRSIWNHASEKAMSRDGWLQFSVIAKDCELKHAIHLCRNWTEFAELNLLTTWQYFPASNWVGWNNGKLISQLHALGFFPYFMDLQAEKTTRHFQVGGRGQGRRQHDMVEVRNVLVGHMKRNDPITRRFLQYLLMRTGELLVMVRDGKTGRVITAPPDEMLWTYRRKQGLGRASKHEWENVMEMGPDFFDMTDRLRPWRFGFDDYYDVFIWDFVPGQGELTLYNTVIMDLRLAWRLTRPRDLYANMAPLLKSLTRDAVTMRTRQIKPGENVQSIWEMVSEEGSSFQCFEIRRDGQAVTVQAQGGMATSPYLFYNEANVVEDAVLFPDELASDNQNVPFREIKNGVSRIEGGILPSTVRHLTQAMDSLELPDSPEDALHAINDQTAGSIWALPAIWETSLAKVRQALPEGERLEMLERTGLLTANSPFSIHERLTTSDKMEILERDRSFGFKEAFHAGDLEPGCTEKYYQVLDTIDAIFNIDHAGSTEWVWFLVETLDWLQLRADYDEYTHDPSYPWPHSFIIQDLVLAFTAMAMFFPESDLATPVTEFLKSERGEGLRNSSLFDPKERSRTRPDRRTRTSYQFRDQKFWVPLNKFLDTKEYFAKIYPMDWSIAIRPIIAKLYRAGVVAPAHLQNNPAIVGGIATAVTEPHRPDKLDLFINYQDRCGSTNISFPSSFIHPSKWPAVLPAARKFAATHENARFGLLRLWSAPHFYPLMIGLQNRQCTSFLDSRGRSWEWKFVPKDMRGSEYSVHQTNKKRLDLLEKQFGDRVVHRGDLILVMGEDSADLFKYCTAVTFAMQTKPWLREVDFWKSFINVSWDFVRDLEPFWLD